MSYPAPTTGIGVATQVAVDSTSLSLSLSGVNTHQIVAQVKDVAGTIVPGVVLTLTAAANASGGTTAYTGTITGGGTNALVGRTFVVAGFVTGANNGTFICTASSATVLTLDNAAGVAETHAGTATEEGASAFTFVSFNPGFATVSATGLVTGVTKGGAVVGVSYAAFGGSGKIYQEINVSIKL